MHAEELDWLMSIGSETRRDPEARTWSASLPLERQRDPGQSRQPPSRPRPQRQTGDAMVTIKIMNEFLHGPVWTCEGHWLKNLAPRLLEPAESQAVIK